MNTEKAKQFLNKQGYGKIATITRGQATILLAQYEQENLNPVKPKVESGTSKRYNFIIKKYWDSTKGKEIYQITDAKGNRPTKKEDVKKAFADIEKIDVIITNKLFDSKYGIAQNSVGKKLPLMLPRQYDGIYWGLTCTSKPSLELANNLRKASNNLKKNSREKMDKIEKINKASELFK